MFRKLEENLWRVNKEFANHLLIVLYHSQNEMLRLKVVAHQEPGQDARKYYYKDFHYAEMPDLIRHNFQNMGEIIEEVRITAKDHFHFDAAQAVLKVGLQIGSKLKQCLFQLQQMPFTYLETIELVLWEAEKELERVEQPEQLYFHELRQLRIVNERHTLEINHLSSCLNAERVERQKLQENYEGQVTQLRTEIYEMRMNMQASHEQKWHSEPSESQQPNQRVQRESSSLIYEEREMNIEFINLDEEECVGKIEKENKLAFSKFRFKLDINSGSDVEHAFTRRGQRISLKKKGEKHMQYSSLLPLSQPIGIVSFKLHHSKEFNIYLGVLLHDRIKKSSTTRDERAISYKLKGGKELWEDGIRASTVFPVVNRGDVLSLLVNGIRRTMQWWISGKQIVERSIPLAFQDKEMYPFINMIHEGDCVEFV